MTNYVRRVEEFDARQYLPNDPNFDIQGFMDWIMSFEGKGGTWPDSVTLNQDNTITIAWFDPAYSAVTSESTVSEGMFGVVRVVPSSDYEVVWFESETYFESNFEEK